MHGLRILVTSKNRRRYPLWMNISIKLLFDCCASNRTATAARVENTIIKGISDAQLGQQSRQFNRSWKLTAQFPNCNFNRRFQYARKLPLVY